MAGQSDRKAALLDQVARVGKALANGRRLQILDLLAQGERAVEAIATATGMNLTTASANLQALKSGGLVEARREGPGSTTGLLGKTWQGCSRWCKWLPTSIWPTWRSRPQTCSVRRRMRSPVRSCCGGAKPARSPWSTCDRTRIPGRPYPGRHQYPDSRTGRPARRTSWRPRHCRLLSWCLLRHGPRCRPHRARRGRR